MNTTTIITALAIITFGLSLSGHAADTAKTAPAPDTTAPPPKADTPVPLPIPPDLASGPRDTMKPPVDASMGYVDPKYKSGMQDASR
jgi:hypothetical protein